MERAAVLQWLQGVQGAPHSSEEFNEGFIDPDKSSSSQHSTKDYSRSAGSIPSPLIITPSSSISPIQSASARRATFKLTKSNTICGNDPPKTQMNQPYLTKKNAPSFDVPDRDLKLLQSSLSPLPSFNPDFVLPTIHLSESEMVVPDRKPLIHQSSTAFLSKLKTKTPRQYQLLQSSKCKSVDLPQCVKSAPCSPNWQRRYKMSNQRSLPCVGTSFSNWDVSQVDMEPVGQPVIRKIMEPASQTILPSASTILTKTCGEQMSDNTDSTVGSCVAEQGESSDAVSSGDMEVADEDEVESEARGTPISPLDGETGMQGKADGYQVAAEHHKYPVKNQDQLKPDERVCAVQHTILQCVQQEKVLAEPSPLPSEPPPSSKTAEKGLAELLCLETMGAENLAARVSKSNYLQQHSSAKHIRSLSDDLSHGPSPFTSSPGHDSLAFHDHHLGRVSPHGLVRSPTVDDCGSRKSVTIGPSKLHGHSPLLGRRITQDRNIQDLLSDCSGRGDKSKPNAAVRVGWLSKSTYGASN